MVGALNKLPISISGMIFFSDPVTFGSVTGVIIAFLGGILYSYAKSEQARQTVGRLPVPVTDPSLNKHGLAGADASNGSAGNGLVIFDSDNSNSNNKD
ncbi:GDP-mannose transporter into the lumen of the Golgi [Physocladia obscura]|uniref:GDP-mannose transporter into the lumen of the Golgi n=1 Tax=Physocladia obscura TaxID=109957 RepID=A0AAD5SUM0_9FUNG|nr:GDP-mannose transporter into the lumen of the Golgi [Physocladia obscura]